MIKLLTHFDRNRARTGKLCAVQMEKYCRANGYGFHCSTEVLADNPYFNKIKLLRRHMESADYLLWLDSDCLIVDQEFRIEYLIQPKFPMLISQDSAGVCAGAFLLKNCLWSHRLLETWDFLGVLDRHDQNTLKAMMQFPHVSAGINRIAESIISNRESKVKSAFVHHYWASAYAQEDLEKIILADLNKV